MHLTSKKLAFLGVLMAVDILLIILSGILEFNTLFLLAAASFCVGLAIRECRLRMGFGFFTASLLLGVILAPNKLYCITYAAMGLYIVITEFAYDRLTYVKRMSDRIALLWIIKYLTFNIMYIPILFLSPKLIYSGHLSPALYFALILAGQVFLYIYDWTYMYFQGSIWTKAREKIKF